MHRLLLVISLITFSLMTLVAQEVEWSVDATVMLNNREGGDGFTPDQTFMFTRLAPEVGISLHDGAHALKGGAVWYQPMVDNMNGYKVLPTLYYRYNRDDGWHVTAGQFPRSLLVERMPRYLWSDSLDYCQPNMRGAMAQLVKPAGFAEVAIDWRQLQTEYKREAFTAMINTDWRVWGPLRLGGHLHYSHLAMSRHNLVEQNQHVNDDFIINPMLSLDLSRHTVLDSLRVSAGAIIAMERDRGDDLWHKPAGFVATATARWHWLQLDETFYKGQALMPLYGRWGSLLNQGDPYYNNKTYSRTDLIFHIVSNDNVDLSGSLVFHATDKVTGFWQQITCRFYLDNHQWTAARNKH